MDVVQNIIMTIINGLINFGNFLWGAPMLISLCVVSVMYTIGTKGFQFKYFGHVMKNTFGDIFNKKEGSGHGISSFKAMCMALCNTIGVGNIAGVSLAISLGGPGALFWLWVAGLLGLILKYGEIVLGVKYREIDPETGKYKGGLMWYVNKGLGGKWRWLATFYAGFYAIVIINAPAVQVNTLAASVTTYFDVNPMIIGVICAILMALVLLGGLTGISEFASKVIPFSGLTYIAVIIIVIAMNITALPETLIMVFKGAFADTQAMAGGFGGASAAMAIRHGLARGFFSNGAGSGDAPFSHSSADVDHPSKQGMWGIAETVIDVLVCTSTALAVLVTGAWETGESGVALTAKAVSMTFGSEAFGDLLIMVIVIFFAFTTAVMCGYYGEICLGYLFKKKAVINVYRVVLCLMAVLSTSQIFVERVDLLWRFSDAGLGVNIMISIIVLVLLRKEVYATTQEYKDMLNKNK